MNVLILGANGNVGSQVAHKLIQHGHNVVANVRHNKDRVPEQAKIISINLTNETEVIAALKDSDAVVCALSSWHAPHHNVLSTTMQVLIPAMEKAGVKRIVSISGDIALLPNESPSLMTKILRKLLLGTVREVVLDSEDHLRRLHASRLDWTVLRPTTMTSSNSAIYHLQSTHPRSLLIPRAAVVASIVDLIENHSFLQQAPFITSR